MRIVAGRYAGRELTSPAGAVRPTSEPIRDAILNLVVNDVRDARVLDLFAGTGALGLEAISRGAAKADFVENGPAALHALKANVAALRLRERTRIFKRDAIPFVDALPEDAYDIAFADPPYGSRKADRVVEAWKAVRYARLLIVEHAGDHALPPGGRAHRLGETSVTIFDASKPRAGARRTGRRGHPPAVP